MRDRDEQPDAREGQAGRVGVAERPVIPMKPGNAGRLVAPNFGALLKPDTMGKFWVASFVDEKCCSQQ